MKFSDTDEQKICEDLQEIFFKIDLVLLYHPRTDCWLVQNSDSQLIDVFAELKDITKQRITAWRKGQDPTCTS